MNRPDSHPRFDFDSPVEPVPQPENDSKKPDNKTTEPTKEVPRTPLWKSKRPEGSDGWCGDCDMALGQGNCVRCIRIKRQRGEEYPAPLKTERKKVVRGRFPKAYDPDLARVREIVKAAAEKNTQDAARRKQFDKIWRSMTQDERAAFSKMTPGQKAEWLDARSK